MKSLELTISSLVGYFKKTNAFLVYAICFLETVHGVNIKAFGNWKSLRTQFCQTLAKLRLNNWPNVSWEMEGNFWVEFFPPTPRTKAVSQAKKESLFRAFRLLNMWKRLLNIWKISSSKTERQSWSRAWKLSWSRFSTETQRNALNFWECMLDRLARDSFDLNPLGRRTKLTQYSILYCFLMVHVSSKSVKISAQQVFMKVLKSL